MWTNTRYLLSTALAFLLASQAARAQQCWEISQQSSCPSPRCAWSSFCSSKNGTQCSSLTSEASCRSVRQCAWAGIPGMMFCFVNSSNPCEAAASEAQCSSANVQTGGDCLLSGRCVDNMSPMTSSPSSANVSIDACERQCELVIQRCRNQTFCNASLSVLMATINGNSSACLDNLTACAQPMRPTNATAATLYSAVVNCAINCSAGLAASTPLPPMTGAPTQPAPTMVPQSVLDQCGLQCKIPLDSCSIVVGCNGSLTRLINNITYSPFCVANLRACAASVGPGDIMSQSFYNRVVDCFDNCSSLLASTVDVEASVSACLESNCSQLALQCTQSAACNRSLNELAKVFDDENNTQCVQNYRACAAPFRPADPSAAAIFDRLINCTAGCLDAQFANMPTEAPPPPCLRNNSLAARAASSRTVITTSNADLCGTRCEAAMFSCLSNPACAAAVADFGRALPSSQCYIGQNLGSCAAAFAPAGTDAAAILAQRLYNNVTSCYLSCQLEFFGMCEFNSTNPLSPCRNPSCFDALSGTASPTCCQAVSAYCLTVGDRGCQSRTGLAGMCSLACISTPKGPAPDAPDYICPECAALQSNCISNVSCFNSLVSFVFALETQNRFCGANFTDCMRSLGNVSPLLFPYAQCAYGCYLKKMGICPLFDNSTFSPCRTVPCLDTSPGVPNAACCNSTAQYCSPALDARPSPCADASLANTCLARLSTGPIFVNCSTLNVTALTTAQSLTVSVRVLGTADGMDLMTQTINVSSGEGSANVTFHATDRFNVSSSCTVRVSVIDRTPPVIVCPAPVTVVVASGQYLVNSTCTLFSTGGTLATLVNGSNCGANGRVTDDFNISRLVRSPPVGALLPVGSNTVTYTAFDRRGNSASCNATVTVLDEEPPTLLCPASTVLPESGNSVLTPMPVCFAARDNDVVAEVNVSSMKSTVTLNAATELSAASISRSILNYSISRKPNSQELQTASVCVVLYAQPPSVQPIRITLVDGSGNTASCTLNLTLTISARSAQLTNMIDTLASGRVNASLLSAVTGSLQNLTANVAALSPAQYSRSAQVLSQLVNASRSTGPINISQASEVVAVFNQVLSVSPEQARQAQEIDGGITTVRDALSSFVESFNGTTTPFSYSGPNLDLTVQPIVGAFAGFNFSSGGDAVEFQIPALPGSGGTLAFTTFPNDLLFPSANATATVLSRVVDVVIVGRDTSNLNPPAEFSLEVPPGAPAADLQCVYYDTATSTWSTRGVTTVGGSGNTKKCSTTHFTNFAVLLSSGTGSSRSTNAKALAIITLVGCCLALFCIAVTLAAHVSAPRRVHAASRILVGFCVALALTFIFFIAASQLPESKPSEQNCRGVGMALHYFLLLSFFFLVSLTIQLYASTASATNSVHRARWHVVGFGVLALAILALCIGIGNPSSYGGESFCWINDRPVLIGGVLVPIAVALAVIAALSLFTHQALKNASEKKTASLAAARQQLNAIVGSSTLMGLVWFFGVLINVSNGDASVFVQYCFAIFAIILGLVLFVMFVLFSPTANPRAVESKTAQSFPTTLDRDLTGVSQASTRTGASDLELRAVFQQQASLP